MHACDEVRFPNPANRTGRFTCTGIHVIAYMGSSETQHLPERVTYPVHGASGLLISSDERLNGQKRIGIHPRCLPMEPGVYDVVISPAPKTSIIAAVLVSP